MNDYTFIIRCIFAITIPLLAIVYMYDRKIKPNFVLMTVMLSFSAIISATVVANVFMLM
ncbi:hypothetical protein [Apilactobacillus apinorum]|uniref:hypothetical protein n=1 Tax=Apilactobacillus apinorum TaxID=1218495 RepID=UPI000A86B45D|nr:hypothetical protein [Apilactobacillus apinorum]